MKGNEMVDSLGFYALLLLGLLCLGVLCSWLWLRRMVAMASTDRRPAKPSTGRSADPKPVPGLIIKPTCVCGEQTPAPPPPPGVSPQLIVTRRRRPRNVETQESPLDRRSSADYACDEPSCLMGNAGAP